LHRRFLDQIDEQQNDRGDLEEYFGNPINAFITIKRLVHDWKFNVFDPVFDSSNFETYKNNLSDSLEKINFKGPTQEDLHGATRALLRLQNMYQLNTDHLASGVLHPGEKNALGTSLSASDCFELGRLGRIKNIHPITCITYIKHGSGDAIRKVVQLVKIKIYQGNQLKKMALLLHLLKSQSGCRRNRLFRSSKPERGPRRGCRN